MSVSGRSRHQGRRRLRVEHAALVATLVLISSTALVLVRRATAVELASPSGLAQTGDARVALADFAPISLGLAPRRELDELAPAGGDASTASDRRSAEHLPNAERAFYGAFLLEERSTRGALDRRADAFLASDASTIQKTAFLRAAFAVRTPRALEHFESVLRPKSGLTTHSFESLSSFALRFLCVHAKGDPDVRAMLLHIAFADRDVAEGLRAEAAATYAGSATEPELEALERELRREDDSPLAESVIHVLIRNAASPAARRIALRSPSYEADVARLASSEATE